MDEYSRDDDIIEDEIGAEDEYEAVELGGEAEAAAAEAADLSKILKQHPEIWIPYEEQVYEKLNPHTPGTTEINVKKPIVGLRDLSILDKNHKTYPFVTNYEATKCISFRASQICNGARPYILVPPGMTDAFAIAKIEFETKRLPYILKRPLPDGSFEVWKLSDLTIF